MDAEYWYRIIFFCSIGLVSACIPHQERTFNNSQWKSTEEGVYQLAMAGVLMEVDTETGGRIKTLAIDGVNLMTGPEIHRINYGSTLWLSPQEIWYWPPPATLDHYTYDILQSSDTLYLRSDIDPEFGVSFSKKFIPQRTDTSFLMTYSLENHTDSLQSYAIWEVTRMKKDSHVFFSLEEDSTLRSIRESFWTIRDRLVKVSISATDTLNNKMYANGQGWLIYKKDSLALIKVFPDLSPKQLPPTHNEIEVYIAKSPYQEVEQHSPYVSLRPGEVYNWQVQWYLRKFNGQADLKKWINRLQNRKN